jgi:hypothetical protein
MMELRHIHTRHHSQSGAFAPVIKIDSDTVFEVAPTRQMCARMGVGVQFSAPYAHHVLGKAERPWRTIWDNAYPMLYIMAVPNFMLSCTVNTVVYMRNRTCSCSVGLTGGAPLTLLASSALDASKFGVFGCTVFAKVPDKLRREFSEIAFRGVMVGFPPGTCRAVLTLRHAFLFLGLRFFPLFTWWSPLFFSCTHVFEYTTRH